MELKKLIDTHIQYHLINEEPGWKLARAYYNNKFYKDSVWAEAEHDNCRTSENMVYAITETAVTSLVGGNPTATAKPRRMQDVEMASMAEDVINQLWDLCNIRGEMTIAVTDSTLLGRSIYKTTMCDGVPITLAQDPSTVFFDPEARRPSEITYWLQATVLTMDQVKAKQKQGLYKRSLKKIKPSAYPTWLVNSDAPSSSDLRNLVQWVVIWEYYDVANCRVQHYAASDDVMLLDEKMEDGFQPFSLLQANFNGVDCRGISEIQLILPQQVDLNDALSQMKLITMSQRPQVGYDANELSQETVADGAGAATAAYVGFKRTKNTKGTHPPMRDLFFQPAYATVPGDLIGFIEKTESIISVVSALAESARGQVTGAQTATEMALIDAQSRTRLSSRESNLHAALSDVADKMLYLWSKYGKEGILIGKGNGRFEEIKPKDLRDVQVRFQISIYNPARSNPLVEAEMFNQIYSTLLGDPAYDARAVKEEYLRVNKLSPALLLDEDEMALPEAEAEAMPEMPLDPTAMLDPNMLVDEGAAQQEMPLDPNTIQAAALDAAQQGLV